MLEIVVNVLSSLLVFITLLVVGLWCWFHWSYRRMIREASKLPVIVPTFPLLGHAPYTALGMQRIVQYALEMCISAAAKGIPATCFWCGPIPFVLVNNLDDIQKILNSSCALDKPDEYAYSKALGEGLLTAPAHVWKITRRHLNPLFHPRNVENLMPVFNRNSRELVSVLSEHVGSQPVNLMEYTKLTALLTVCHLVFGRYMKFDMCSEKFKGFAHVVEKVGEFLVLRSIQVWLRSDAIFEFLYKKDLMEINDLWENFTRTPLKIAKFNHYSKEKICQDDCVQDDNAANSEETLNLIDVYTAMQQLFPKFTDKELQEEMVTLYATEKVFNEISQTVGPEDEVSSQDLLKMTYLDQVLKETLRWSTLTPFITRKTNKDLKLSCCTIPAGHTVTISFMSVHMNPEIFPEPEKFKPERFSPENAERKEKYFFPFSGGPRNCIGKLYANMLMKVMIVHVLRKYKLTTNMDIHNMKRVLKTTLISAEGYNVFLENRR